MKPTPYQNNTFRGHEPTWANACVGNNGNPQIIDYANGFSAAAKLLLDQVIADEGMKQYVDDLIYPICFNIRHSVELHLKATAVKLERLSTHRTRIPPFDLAGSHDIGRMWAYITEHSGRLDKRYLQFISRLDKYINDIADVDATGQVFRYPFNTENKKHLVDVALINIVLLKRRFNRLENILKDLHRLNLELLEEYSLGSYTSKLSRKEMFEVASMLPPRDQWGLKGFDEIKAKIRETFELGSNDLSKAVKIIERNYEMAQLISATPSLPNVTISVLEAFFDCWAKLHDISKLRMPPEIEAVDMDDADGMIHDIMKRREIKAECWRELSPKLDPSTLSEITALFYFHYENKYTERLQKIFELHHAEISMLHEKHPEQYKAAVFHILDKTSGLENILHSLYVLGQVDIAEALYKRYDLVGCFSWLSEMRNKFGVPTDKN